MDYILMAPLIYRQDHAPFLPAEKDTGYGDIFKAPAGTIGIDLRLP